MSGNASEERQREEEERKRKKKRGEKKKKHWNLIIPADNQGWKKHKETIMESTN